MVFEIVDIAPSNFRHISGLCLAMPTLKRFEIGVHGGRTQALVTLVATAEHPIDKLAAEIDLIRESNEQTNSEWWDAMLSDPIIEVDVEE